MTKLEQAEAVREEHSKSNCRLCELAIWDVEAPGCPIAIGLVRAVRDAERVTEAR